MKKFEYEITVNAESQSEADSRMKSITAILNRLSTKELKRAEEVVNNPVELAMLKTKLL
jgi:hypothetical protein